nr:MAG TPA: hypothetical protein [Caudoviricetes sp.]
MLRNAKVFVYIAENLDETCFSYAENMTKPSVSLYREYILEKRGT